MTLQAKPSRGCILVIDDSIEMQVLDRIVLESAGYQVYAAFSCEDAFNLMDQIPKIQLILLDYNLPEMNGNEFVTLLEIQKPNIFENVPIVFHSGMDSLKKGKATGIIKKVTDINNFLEAIRHFIEIGHPQ